jgi:hypothetical protein
MDEIQTFMDDVSNKELELHEFKWIYENTVNSKHAPIRKFAAAICNYSVTVGEWKPADIVEILEEYPGSSLGYIGVQVAYGNLPNHCDSPYPRDYSIFTSCFFHTHDNGEECMSEDV